jgi:hypothetical protein
MQLNYDDELDYILKALINEYENSFDKITFYTEDENKTIKDKISQKVAEKFKLKEWEINLLYYTLLIDNNLKTIDPLIISLAGIVFINKGGYVNKNIQEKKEKNRIEKVETDLTKYTFLLMVFTAIVSLGTVISAWYFFLEIIEYYKHH